MTAKTVARALPDSYFKLVKQFPLTHIRDDRHLEAAQEVLDKLLTEDLDWGAQEYLDALTDLVETYEDNHVPIPDASEADVLRVLMEANQLSQQQLAKKAGIAQSTLSAVLNGSRSLTKEHVVKLAKLFRVSPAAFLPA
jgi:HTH-type transcriptional regulator/antitoxin HigA